jgi:hypothetical protein
MGLQELWRSLFSGLLVELFVVVVSLLLRDDKRKLAVVLVFGTMFAGTVAFGDVIINAIAQVPSTLARPTSPVTGPADTVATPVPPTRVPPTAVPPTRVPSTATTAPLVSDFAVISVSSNSEQSAPYVNLGLEISSRKSLLNIPFETGWTSTTQCSHVPERPTTLQYNVDIPRPTNVYLLLQGGWALQEYNGKEVGYVLLGFSGGANNKTSLALGFNFRDWSVDKPNAVTTASSPTLREAWQGIAPDGAKGRFDILTIEIPSPLTQSRLTSVQIVDTSTTTTGSVNPCIHLTGITVKYFRQ